MASLQVKVVPGSKRDRVASRYGAGVKVQVSAPPEDGKANQRVVEVVADWLGVRPSAVRIVRGQFHPSKTLELDVDETTLNEAVRRLQ